MDFKLWLLSFLKEYWSELTLVIGGVISYFLGRNDRKLLNSKIKSEVVGSDLLNIEKALGIYKSSLDQVEKNLVVARKEYVTLEIEFFKLKNIETEDKRKIKALSGENKTLMDIIVQCEKKCHLKSEIGL